MTDRHLNKMAEKPKLGKQVLNFLISDTNRRKISRQLKDRARTRMIRQMSREGEFHLDEILNICLKHIAPINSPIALMTQVPHSGGSLLSRLFDGHSQLHTVPGTLISERNRSRNWPRIDLSFTPQEWLKDLTGHFDLKTFRNGFRVDETGIHGNPHMYLPVLQERIFINYLSSLAKIGQRDVFDAWMTACFGAWINYQNHGDDKKFIATLVPGMAVQLESVGGFFDIYPEGRLIALIRGPAQWYAAASRGEPQLYSSFEAALNRWRDYTRKLLETRKKFADRICLIEFEDLISRTDRVMQHLAAFLEISFEESLLVPTFNGYPIQTGSGQGSKPFDRSHRQINESISLDQDQQDTIEKITAADYQAVTEQVAAVD